MLVINGFSARLDADVIQDTIHTGIHVHVFDDTVVPVIEDPCILKLTIFMFTMFIALF